MTTYNYHPGAFGSTEIAQRLGLHRAGRGWRGACPICGYRDAFALDIREGRILGWCSNCGDKAAVAAALRSAAGGVPLPRPAAEKLPRHDRADPAARLARARAVWAGGLPIEPGTPAALYLHRRRIPHVASSPALRWRADVPHPSGGRHLALIAAVSGPDGEFQGLQRIFLDRHGAKADIEPVKASLGTIAGGAVRLQSCSSELVIGEGIETSAAAGALLGLPAWAAVSAGNMANSLILPEAIRTVVIAVDRDPAGERAAREAWRRWTVEGRQVRLATPREKGKDFNTLAMEGVR